jgi:hypothetical protein
MIKTLRITSIVVVIVAGIFFVFPIVFGARHNKDADRFINSPSVVEQFNSTFANKNTGENKISPLVKQAEAFALYLNPPVKPKPAPTNRRDLSPTIPRPERVSTKFTLIGTSFFPAKPEQSLAFINEPGKGLRWVRQASEIGHLIIEQIEDGFVVIRDGQRTYEIEVSEKPARINLLEGEKPFSKAPASTKGFPSNLVDTSTDEIFDKESSNHKSTFKSKIDNEDGEVLEELVGKLKGMQKSFKSNKTDSGPTPEEKAALMEQLISKFKSPRVSPEEAEKLDNLGKKLKDVEKEPNISP